MWPESEEEGSESEVTRPSRQVTPTQLHRGEESFHDERDFGVWKEVLKEERV